MMRTHVRPIDDGNGHCAVQENIKDKLHGIPIDVSVKILDGNRKRRQSAGAQLSPVLDAKDDPQTRSMVSTQRPHRRVGAP